VITITDLWGQPIRKFETGLTENIPVNLSDEKAGVYLVIIAIGNELFYQKLVVRH
jgi:hypothetical protein